MTVHAMTPQRAEAIKDLRFLIEHLDRAAIEMHLYEAALMLGAAHLSVTDYLDTIQEMPVVSGIAGRGIDDVLPGRAARPPRVGKVEQLTLNGQDASRYFVERSVSGDRDGNELICCSFELPALRFADEPFQRMHRILNGNAGPLPELDLNAAMRLEALGLVDTLHIIDATENNPEDWRFIHRGWLGGVVQRCDEWSGRPIRHSVVDFVADQALQSYASLKAFGTPRLEKIVRTVDNDRLTYVRLLTRVRQPGDRTAILMIGRLERHEEF